MAECDLPEVANGHITSDGVKFGDKISLRCDTGYNLIGDATMVCMAGGMWSKDSTCEIAGTIVQE